MAGNDDQMPAWLTNDAPAPAPAAAPAAAPAPAPSAKTNTPAAAPAPAAQSAVNDDPEQLKGIILFTRLLNLGVSIAVIAHAVYNFIGLPNLKFWILGFYATIFGCLICCLETQLKFIRTAIALNFGFLFDPFLRFWFYILMATVELSFERLWPQILAGVLAGTALYNTYVLCKYPAYRKMRDQIALEEDKRIEARLRDRMRKEATAAMFHGRDR